MSAIGEVASRHFVQHKAWNAKRLPIYPLLLGLVACLIFVFPQTAKWLQYDRTAIAAGELWRLITGHWTHWNGDHLLWDVAAFLGLGMLCERLNRAGFIVCLLAASMLVPMAVWRWQPEMIWYRGLSGLDSALFLFGATWMLIDSIRQRHMPTATITSLATLAFIGKVVFEATSHSAVFVQAQGVFVPVPVAHLAGGLTGMVCALLTFVFVYSRGNGIDC